MLPSSDRISLVGLYCFRRALEAANHKYRLYQSAISNTNKVIEQVERMPTCATLSRELFKLSNEIRASQKGIQDSTGVLAHDDDDVSAENVSQRMLAKALGRSLLQEHHPDRGGDPAKFKFILDAVRRGDVLLLQFLSAQSPRVNLTWQCNEGIEHLTMIASVYESRLSKVRSNPLTGIARLYLQGKKEQAEKQLATFLQARISERRIELHNLLNRSFS